MEELTKVLSRIELVADDIIDGERQIENLVARKLKTQEASNRLKEQQQANRARPTRKHWVCLGDMFIRLTANEVRNLIVDDHYELDTNIEKLREEQKEKVALLRKLEGKPELTGFNLKPLNKSEIAALRTAFKI